MVSNSIKSTPKISIITVVFNSGIKLRDTLDSVCNQNYNDYEVLIIDGQSTDNTLEIARSYENIIGNLRIYSEPDKGIYDAMNKGIQKAQGDYMYFLNAGDVLYDDNVFCVVSQFLCENYVYYGNAFTKDSSGALTEYRCGHFSKYRLAITNICHQTIFYPSYYMKKECFNIKYVLFADCEMNMKLWSKTKFIHMDVPIIVYEGGGVSDNGFDKQYRRDRRYLVYKYLGFDAWMYILYSKILRYLK